MPARLTTRVIRLEKAQHARQGAEPYEVHSACGRVIATVTPGPGVPMVAISFPYPELSAPQALALVADELPVRCYVFVSSRTEFTLEEYEAWVARDGPHTDGSPLLFGRIEQTVH